MQIDRRRMAAGLAILVLPLSGCLASWPGGGGEGVSAEAAAHVNAIRAKAGLGPLKPDRGLEAAAVRQAGFMTASGRMVHKTGFRRDFATRMDDVETRGLAAENLAHGRFDRREVVAVWLHSPPHRANLLNEAFTRFGLGYARDGGDPSRRYWAMVLAA